MLSATNSRNDVKTVLRKDFTFFGFETEGEFDLEIDRILGDTEDLMMKPRIGESLYNTIADKDQSGFAPGNTLEPREKCAYKSEVYFAASRFVLDHAAQDNVDRTGEGESIAVEGFSRTVAIGSSAGSIKKTSGHFKRLGWQFLAKGGFGGRQLQRGGNFWTQPRSLRAHTEFTD